MKLRNKGLLIVGSLWACFLVIGSFLTIQGSLFNFISLGALFAFSMVWLVDVFIVKQAEQAPEKKAESSQNIQKEQVPAVPSHENPLAWLSQGNPSTTSSHAIFFNEALNKAISHAKRRHQLLAVLLAVIQPVKILSSTSVNGVDELALKEIEKRLASTLRHEDFFVKLEGHEFRILLNDIGKAKFASAVANKIVRACAQPVKTAQGEMIFGTHIGICVYPTEGTSLEDLLKNADIALSKAKNAGVGVFQFYTQAMNAEASEYIHLEKSLRKAITNHELMLYYQPKVHLKTGNVARLEALVRWVHPEIGVIHPEKFLSIAEETGLIHAIGEWTLREACKMNKEWQDAGYAHMPIAVNLSSRQFYHPDIVQTIAAVLKETGLNPTYLELEITETAIMQDAEHAMRILEEIKSTGVQISIDHFGSGYFSISQLKQFPLTLLKIDQSFIKGVPNNPNDSAITTAIIALAHNLGLEVVAEGVETAEQMQYLSAQNCDMVQGYFLSQPLPAEQVVLQFKKLMEGVLL